MSDSNANGFLPHSEKQFLHGDFSRALKLFNSSFVFLDVLCFSPSFCPYFPYGGGEQGALNLVDFKVPHEKNLHCVGLSSHGSEKPHLSFLFPNI